MSQTIIKAATIVVLAVLIGCSAREPKLPAPVSMSTSHPEYIDLQPGWRLRVVTPLSRTGTYRLKYRDEKRSGAVITLTADDFKGYETAYYAVEARKGGGVRIKFVSAELMLDGTSATLSQSIRPLFQLPRKAKFVRLIYLTRVSKSDHDMAVVASDRMEQLEELTRAISANDPPEEQIDGLSWIPAGVAVRAEKTRAQDAGWVPAR